MQRSIIPFKKLKNSWRMPIYNLNGQRYETAANRAYYCAYTSVKALLQEKEIYAKTHTGVQNKFNQLFVLPRIFDSIHSSRLSQLYQLRQIVDYDLSTSIDEEATVEAVKYARELLIEVKKWAEENL